MPASSAPTWPPTARGRAHRLGDGQRIRTVVENACRRARGLLLADVTEPAESSQFLREGLDAVCHIAGQVSIIRSFSDPVADLRTNVEGTLNVLKLCLKYKVPRLVYASSMTLYGQLRDHSDARDRALPPGFLLRHHQACGRTIRPLDGGAAGPGFRFQCHLAAHVQRLRARPVLQQSLSGRARHLFGQPAARGADHHFRRRRADARLRLHRRHRRRLGAGLEHARGRRRVFNLAAADRSRSTSLPSAAIAAFGHPPGGYKVIRAPHGRASSAPSGRYQPGKVGAGLAAAHDLRRRAGPDRPLGARRVRGRADGRSAEAAHEAPARYLGRSLDAQCRHHPQVGRGRPRAGPRGRRLRSTRRGIAEAALHDRPRRRRHCPVGGAAAVGFPGHAHLARLLDGVPRERAWSRHVGALQRHDPGGARLQSLGEIRRPPRLGMGRMRFGPSRTPSCSPRSHRAAPTCSRSCSMASMPARSPALDAREAAAAGAAAARSPTAPCMSAATGSGGTRCAISWRATDRSAPKIGPACLVGWDWARGRMGRAEGHHGHRYRSGSARPARRRGPRRRAFRRDRRPARPGPVRAGVAPPAVPASGLRDHPHVRDLLCGHHAGADAAARSCCGDLWRGRSDAGAGRRRRRAPDRRP